MEASEGAVGEALETLWRTRKTGLSTQQKLHFRSLLYLHSLPDISPVLASLRAVIRRSLNQNFSEDDIPGLLPPNLSPEVQSIFVKLLPKHSNQWKEEVSRDKSQTQAHESCQAKTKFLSAPSLIASGLSSETCLKLYDTLSLTNNCSLYGETSFLVDPGFPCMSPVFLQKDSVSANDLKMLPHLESISWTFENKNTKAADRLAIVSLKLQDCTRSSHGNIEVKFLLSRDKLESLLRSMEYLKSQLNEKMT